ncbi:MAG: ATP-binding cassette domain-containing protein [Actinobacteria bacterium]|nr:ATP-binding cassette domain-containing protein [Actinomycetota bacterium]
MIEFWSLVIAGAVSGGLYAVMASGLVLTYQASGIFNVGQGAVAFATALTYFQLHQPVESGGHGWPIIPAAVVAILIVAPLLGVALDLLIFRRLADAPEAARLVGSVGILIAVPAGALWFVEVLNAIFGWNMANAAGEAGSAPPGIGPTPKKWWSLTEGVAINSDQLAILIVAVLAAVGLWFLMSHTRFGLEARAAVDRPVLARLRGIDTDRASRRVWAISTLLAGCAGVLLAPLFGLAPHSFHPIIFISFAAAVAARLASVPVAFGAGIALGVLQNLVVGYAPSALKSISGFQTSVPFMVMFVLVFFVKGKGREAGSVAEEAPRADPRDDLARWRRWLPWVVAGVGFTAYTLFVASDYWTGIYTRGLAFALIFLSLVVVTGIGGMINLAQATFVTVGGFTVGFLVNHQWPTTMPVLMVNGRLTFWAAVVVAVVVTAAIGLLVALPSLRLGGLTLALATLALAFIGDRLFFQLEEVRNGSSGWTVRKPKYGPIDLGDDNTLFVVLLVMVVAVVGLIGNLNRSATGRTLLALRSSPVAAATAGVSPTRAKLMLFGISAGLAGFGGAWFALVNSPMTNVSAPPLVGMIWLAVAVTFGIRRPGGAVVAGIVYAVMPAVLTNIGTRWGDSAPWSALPDAVRHLIGSPELAALLFGLGAISLAREPDGALAETAHALRARRVAKASSGAAVAAPVPTASSEPAVDASAGGAATPSAESVLAVRDLRAGYDSVPVLHGVDLELRPGSVVAILGPNGAGKSTLCGVVSGALDATSGTILFDGDDVTDSPAHVRAASGLVLAPEARGIFPGLTVDDNLAIRLRTVEQREAAKARFPILAERHKQVAGLLSGGEQQQLAMAVALADPPKVFVADEPALGLSPKASEIVFDALAELRDAGTALILVEEQAGGALRLADEVVLMELGRIAWHGPATEVDVATLGASYLGA